MAIIAVLVLVLAVAVVLPALLGGDDDEEAVGLFSLDSVEVGPTSQPEAEPEWTTSIECEEDACSLAADGQNAYVSISGEADVDSGEVDTSEISAFALGDGEAAWDAPAEVDGDAFVGALPAGVIVGGDEFIVLDPDSGEERWSEPYDSIGGGTADEVILQRTDDDTFAVEQSRVIDLDDGEELFSFDGEVRPCGDGFIGVEDQDRLVALDDDGESSDWSIDLGTGEDSGTPRIECDDDLVTWADGDELTVASLDDGKEAGRIDIDPDSFAAILVDGDTIYLAEDEDVSAHRVDGDGIERLWKVNGPGSTTLALLDDALLVLGFGEGAELFAVDDGTSQGQIDLNDDDEVLVTPETVVVHGDEDIEAFSHDDLASEWTLDVDSIDTVALGGDRVLVLSGDELSSYR